MNVPHITCLTGFLIGLFSVSWLTYVEDWLMIRNLNWFLSPVEQVILMDLNLMVTSLYMSYMCCLLSHTLLSLILRHVSLACFLLKWALQISIKHNTDFEGIACFTNTILRKASANWRQFCTAGPNLILFTTAIHSNITVVSEMACSSFVCDAFACFISSSIPCITSAFFDFKDISICKC